MPGGEIELTYIGAQDLYLVNNPQISFFKSVYKRYTNFALEIKDLDDDSISNTLTSFDNPITLKYKIPRNGDCIKGLYLEFTLPDIYSSSDKQFQWIKNFGHFIIKEIRLVGGDSRIYHRLTGEYLYLYSNIYYSSSKLQLLDRLIGNTTDMFNPALSQHNNGIYPDSILPSLANNNLQIPSINGRMITIPIPFWFSQNLGTALPLISLQNMEFRVEVLLRPLKEWYTVIDTNPLSSTFRSRIRPISDSDKLKNFTDTASDDILNTVAVRARGEFIFLDNIERKQFAQNQQRFLVSQVQYVYNTISIPTGGNVNLDLKDINHPVKKLWFMIRRTDNELVNDWSNFNVFDSNNTNPLQQNYISDTHHNYNYLSANNNSIRYLTNPSGDIIEQLQLVFDGEPRFDILPINYFKNYNIFSTPYINTVNGIYCFAFDLKDDGGYQPSGSCNFSRISKKQLRLQLKNPSGLNKLTGNTNQDIGSYTIIVMAENINFFRIIGGLAGLEYDN